MEAVDEFYKKFMQEVYLRADANEDFIESEFTEAVAEELVAAGNIDDFDYCHYRFTRGSLSLRVDGYSFSEDEGTLNLFISDFRNSAEPESLTKTDIEIAFKRLEKFFMQSLSPNFYPELEETSCGYGLAYFICTEKQKFSKIRMFLFSDGKLSDRIHSLENRSVSGYVITYHVWDIFRLYRMMSSKEGREDIVIDFCKSFGAPLSCLPAHMATEDYQAYLAVIPGQMLSQLYDDYGSRLLEQNVRCFLQVRGNVNKGIRNTILNDPGMFFAYNNGISATAEEITLDKSNGTFCIEKLKNFQIVNGGQTTASIFNAVKKHSADLSNIFVQMKISIIKPEKVMEVVPKISEYANTQNKVNAADFFANHPFHIRMEDYSRRILAPSQDGALRETKWFYERARGQYLDAHAHFTQAKKKKFILEYPKAQMVMKTDLAKFVNSWEEIPYIVSKGAQFNFGMFAKVIGKQWEKEEIHFNELYFKRAIAKAIIFKILEKLVSRQSWYEGGYRANIVAYTLAWIGYKTSQMKMPVDFLKVWERQDISSSFRSTLEQVSKLVYDSITDTPKGVANVTQWCKKEGCWLQVKKIRYEFNKSFLSDLTYKDESQQREADAKKVQKIDNGIDAQKMVLNMGSDKWKEIIEWGVKEKLISPIDVSILNVAANIPQMIPSEKQSLRLMDILSRLEKEGYQL